jgi:hypothetical protein
LKSKRKSKSHSPQSRQIARRAHGNNRRHKGRTNRHETESRGRTGCRRRSRQGFYQKLGFRLNIDYAASEDYRVIQFTPRGSGTSIIFGKGITTAQPGSVDRLVLAVYDIDAACAELRSQGVEASEVFHDAGGASAAAFTQAPRRAFRARIPNADPTPRTPRSAIPTATSGCCRRSGSGFPEG